MDPDAKRSLSYQMVVELLAHQFAFPVKWTDTQDTLFANQKVERMIEIGPSNTLTVMAKRTLASKYLDHDSALSIKRQTLNCKSDSLEIYFANGGQDDTAGPPRSEERLHGSPPVADSAAVAPSLTLDAPTQPTPQITAKITDAPVSSKLVLRTMVAHKLKKATGDINWTESIKALVGGRSTLENELVGDLLSEFGNLPERAEECNLDELATELQTSFKGQLGKQTSALVSKTIATKLPAGFNLGAVRQYLDSRWGLACGLQDSILLFSVPNTPASRYASEAEAKAFFDGIVQRYAAENNLNLSNSTNGAPSQAATAVDPAFLAAIEKQQKDLSRKLMELYANSLQVDLSNDTKSDLEETLEDLQSQLEVWTAEHGEFYASGIKPIFSKQKARHYDSSWNWALRDLLSTYYGLITRSLNPHDPSLEHVVGGIANRSCARLSETVKFLITQAKERGASHEAALRFLEDLTLQCQKSWTKPPVFKKELSLLAPKTTVEPDGTITVSGVPRGNNTGLLDYAREMAQAATKDPLPKRTPLLFMKSKTKSGWSYDTDLSAAFVTQLQRSATIGSSFHGKKFLLTGAGRGSIGAEVLRGLLRGGGQVVVTTSRYSLETTQFFQEIYASHGSRGSKLVLVPFNQGSGQDIESLVRWIFDSPKEDGGLGWDLDFILPFAAISEEGRDVDGIDSRSELAHRIMLTNTIRLLGTIKRYKEAKNCDTRPAQVILPLSANHGIFGYDGLYAESKLGLESLMNKWDTENWCDYLSICGAAIGWTRGTGLMDGNDIVAEGVEELGIRTFSQEEMAFNILCLMTPAMVVLCEEAPHMADLNGRLDAVPELHSALARIRKDIQDKSDIYRAIFTEDKRELEDIGLPPAIRRASVIRRAYIDLGFPELDNFSAMVGDTGQTLHGMVDLERVVVITGFGELGPHGSARTRWEMEAHGQFSLEGCVEMAWVMGLIKHHNGPLKGSSGHYLGWVDATSGQPVADLDIKAKYEKQIIEHSGIRLVEPAMWDGYDPHKKQILQEVVLEEDLATFETSKENALEFRREHGSKADVRRLEDGQYSVKLKKGAVLLIPKALNFTTDIAGLLPTGWDPRTYGIPDDIISQVDKTTLYALISTAEALVSSGITDPYELYRYVHISEVGSCVGTGIGGAASMNKMHKGRYKDNAVQKDILQETFANTVTAWLNMLLISSTGPIRTPVGVCATGLESLDAACDLIVSQKAKIVLVGASDDLEEDMAYEFANMKATANAEAEYAKGRVPKDISRPTASSRKGFVESQGCGIQVVMSAAMALKMAVPIYAIVAFTVMAGDKAGRSVPAPGKGILSAAREDKSSGDASGLLDISRRRELLERRLAEIENAKQAELAASGKPLKHVEDEASRRRRDARYELGNAFWHNQASIAPIRGSLAVWGLTIDDIGVASFHGTSTVLNDRNEFDIVQRQFTHLGRTRGNRILGVFQKHLTGHPKGPAASWMLNGCLQIARSGLVPGNRNADNVDAELEQYDFLAVPDRSIQTDGIKAFSLTSFGFGQKGTQAVGVHPRYLYATLDEAIYEDYRQKVEVRKRRAEQWFQEAMVRNRLVVVKEEPPFAKGGELTVVLDPSARACWDEEAGKYRFG